MNIIANVVSMQRFLACVSDAMTGGGSEAKASCGRQMEASVPSQRSVSEFLRIGGQFAGEMPC